MKNASLMHFPYSNGNEHYIIKETELPFYNFVNGDASLLVISNNCLLEKNHHMYMHCT